MGADADHMQEIYETEHEDLEPWKDSPSEISKDDWRDYLGKRTCAFEFLTDEPLACS